MPGRYGHRPGVFGSVATPRTVGDTDTSSIGRMAAADGDSVRREANPHRSNAYAGIGSRRTPTGVIAVMESVAAAFAQRGCVLRTGASPGADQAFYRGARAGEGAVELYLPWPGFEAQAWADADRARVRVMPRPTPQAYELAARFHPGWPEVAEDQRHLLARDSHQVLGADLASPASLVACWTADGSIDGAGEGADGTRQALRIAHHWGIAVFNLARADHVRALTQAATG
jgi:hypothetical protein